MAAAALFLLLVVIVAGSYSAPFENDVTDTDYYQPIDMLGRSEKSISLVEVHARNDVCRTEYRPVTLSSKYGTHIVEADCQEPLCEKRTVEVKYLDRDPANASGQDISVIKTITVACVPPSKDFVPSTPIKINSQR